MTGIKNFAMYYTIYNPLKLFENNIASILDFLLIFRL